MYYNGMYSKMSMSIIFKNRYCTIEQVQKMHQIIFKEKYKEKGI